MQAMLTKGADVHLRDDQGWTSLMCCCQGAVAPRSASREACLRILLGAGAVVGCENLVGRTALHAAAASGVSHISLCEVLLAWGADATLRSSAGDSPVSCLLRSADRSGDTIPLLRRLSPLLAAAAGVQAELVKVQADAVQPFELAIYTLFCFWHHCFIRTSQGIPSMQLTRTHADHKTRAECSGGSLLSRALEN